MSREGLWGRGWGGACVLLVSEPVFCFSFSI